MDIGFELGGSPPLTAPGARRGLLEVASGVPDPRLLPGAALARAYRRAVLAVRRAPSTGEPQGHPRLREALARMLSTTRAIAAAPERVLVTRGSQMALFLLAEALFTAGDAVAVEALGPRTAWKRLRAPEHGAWQFRWTPRIPGRPARSAGGDDAAAAPSSYAQRQYPTLAVLAHERRTQLLRPAAARHIRNHRNGPRLEFPHFDGRPVTPLASEDTAGVVVHVGTLSKIFSPDLRLGFVHAHSRWSVG